MKLHARAEELSENTLYYNDLFSERLVKENYSLGDSFLVKVFKIFGEEDQKPTKITSNPLDPKGIQESSSSQQRGKYCLHKEAQAVIDE